MFSAVTPSRFSYSAVSVRRSPAIKNFQLNRNPHSARNATTYPVVSYRLRICPQNIAVTDRLVQLVEQQVYRTISGNGTRFGMLKLPSRLHPNHQMKFMLAIIAFLDNF